MPRYEYRCLDCQECVVLTHAAGDAASGCPSCGPDSTLERLYSFSIKKPVKSKTKVGNLVKSHIEEAREELRKEKKELSKKDFKV